MPNFKAAWVPWHDQLGFDGAVLLAVKWLQHRASHGQRTLVVTPLKQTLGYCVPLERLARANYTTTPRSSQRTATPHGVPVLAYALAHEVDFESVETLCNLAKKVVLTIFLPKPE
jgi:hypothetical protein